MNTPKYVFTGRHIVTGETIEFSGSKEMIKAGFYPSAVYAVVAGTQLHTRKYHFTRRLVQKTQENTP